MTLTKTKHFFLLSDPFDKVLMQKLERVNNLWIDIIMKRKELYQLKMLFNNYLPYLVDKCLQGVTNVLSVLKK